MHPAESKNDVGEGYPIVIDTSEESLDDDEDLMVQSSSFHDIEEVGKDGGEEEGEDDGSETVDHGDDNVADDEAVDENTDAVGSEREHDDDAQHSDRNDQGGIGSSSPRSIRRIALNLRNIDGSNRIEHTLDYEVAAATYPDSAPSAAHDSKKWGEIESMNEIEKSPYEAPECAEVGESWFEHLKDALTPVVVNGEVDVNPQLVRPCGEKLASSISTAYQQIGKSGVLFSPSWVEGKIRDVECGFLPVKQLLICLHEHRFLKADERVLHAIVHYLHTGKLIKLALKSWGLVDAFLNLSVNNLFAYSKRKSDCYKCEIFVARAFAIHDILRVDPSMPDESLMTKIKACLSIMSRHVKANPQKLAERQQALEERNMRRAKASYKTTGLERNGSDSEDHGQTQGRVKGPLREIVVTMDNGSGSSGSAANESGVTADSHRIASSSDKKREREERDESLLVMLGIVQEQHARMGQTIEFLRRRIEENVNIMREEMKERSLTERNAKRRRTSNGHKN